MAEQTPRYLKRRDNGEIFAFNQFLAARKDIDWEIIYDVPEPATKTETPRVMTPVDVTVPAGGEDRASIIKAAVSSIPLENYGHPAAGRPAMPKVADVKAITGFAVTVMEVLEALQS